MVEVTQLLQPYLKDGEYIVECYGGDIPPRVKGVGFISKGVALTNHRMIPYETQSKSLRELESLKLGEDIPLESITRAEARPHPTILDSIGSLIGGPAFLRVDLCIFTKKATEPFVFKEILVYGETDLQRAVAQVQEKILQQIKERRRELEQKKTSVLTDFSFLKTYIEKGGIVLTTLKCPHCSAPIKMPKGGAETVCEHCGSTVYAQDIFEKVKKLME